MENRPKNTEHVEKNMNRPWWRKAMSFIVSFLITIPIFPILYKYVPDLNWVYGLDRHLEFLAVLIVVSVILLIRSWFDIAALGIMLTILTIGTVKERGYGIRQLKQDYEVFQNSRKYRDNRIKYKYEISDSQKMKMNSLLKRDLRGFSTKEKDFRTREKERIKDSVDYTNPIVRNFALQQAAEEPFAKIAEMQSNGEIRKIVHAFSVFNTISKNWKYVDDPRGFDYNAKASETINNWKACGKFMGDCDDHAILMAACVTAIGARARIVLSYDTMTRERHAYPELFLGSKYNEETTYYLMEKLFPVYSKLYIGENGYYIQNYEREFNCHIDENGDYWLNLDFTSKYPGGKFLQDSVEYVIDIE